MTVEPNKSLHPKCVVPHRQLTVLLQLSDIPSLFVKMREEEVAGKVQFIYRKAALFMNFCRRQEGFFKALEKGDFGMEQTEFVRGSVEELKRLTLIALTKKPESVKALQPAGSHVKMVYVIADPSDEVSIEPLEDHLYQLGYEVKVLSDEGDPRLTAEVHRQILTVCDGVLIYFGEGSSQWVEMNLMDIMKAPAFGRNRPLDAQAVYLAPPFNRRKERFRSRSTLVMRNGGAGFSPDALSPFLDQLGPPKRS